ncbi:MAG: MBL fold metallo-hydrolase, partial [Chloroflexota bacterium]
VTVCQPGALKQLPTQSQIEALGNIDVLLVPVGGEPSLNATKASELIRLIQPSIAVPIYYDFPNSTMTLDPVEKFLKEMGQSHIEAKDTLRVTRTSLPQETQIVVLESQAL